MHQCPSSSTRGRTSMNQRRTVIVAPSRAGDVGRGARKARRNDNGGTTMTARHTNASHSTLVLGGTGKTGRRVVDRLTARGHLVRVGSRSHTPAFDWNDQSTWPAALRDIGAAYITYYPDLAIHGAAEQAGTFVALALQHGVRRLVLLSGRGEEEAQRTEELLQSSGADWTILRASWFAQNFSESFMADSVRAGELVLPAGTIGESFVHADDIADVAAAALTEDGHVGKLY